MKIKHAILGIEQVTRWAQEARGLRTLELLEGTGIEKSRLADPHALVEPKEELQFYRNLMRLCMEPDLGLTVGYQLTSSCYGIWGLAIQSSTTLLDGIRMGMQYIDFTYTYNRIFYRDAEDLSAIVVEPNDELGELTRFMVQRDMAAIVRLAHDAQLPCNPLQAITLQMSDLAQLIDQQRVFNCPIHLGAQYNEVQFLKSELSRQTNQANPLTWQLCREQLDAMYRSRDCGPHLPLCERVHRALLHQPTFVMPMDKVAQNLGIGARNLRRKLALEGTSYKEILDNVRRRMALEYLQQPAMTLEQIADRLGYRDSTSFSHAYKRWFNKAPRAN